MDIIFYSLLLVGMLVWLALDARKRRARARSMAHHPAGRGRAAS